MVANVQKISTDPLIVHLLEFRKSITFRIQDVANGNNSFLPEKRFMFW